MSSQWNPSAVPSDICIQLDDLLNDFAFGTLDPESTNFVALHLYLGKLDRVGATAGESQQARARASLNATAITR